MRNLWLAILMGAVGAGCNTGSDGGEAPRIFDADADAKLTDEMPSIWTDGPIDESAIDTSNADSVLRTQIEILFDDDATFADAERAIATADGELRATVAGVAGAVLTIPDPGSLDALDAVVQEVEAEEGVWFVRKAIYPRGRRLPFDDSDFREESRHHLVSRTPAAWNVSGAITDDAHVIVYDTFGGGAPVGLGVDVDPSHYDDSGLYSLAYPRGFATAGPTTPSPPPPPSEHGYHVSGLAVAEVGGPDNPVGRATGAYPGAGRLSASDIALNGPLAPEYRALQLAQDADGPSAMNVSLGWHCEGSVSARCQETARREGGAWARRVRQAGLEDRLLITVAAGNIPDGGVESPTMPTSSALIAAAVRDDLIGPGDEEVPPLTNTLAVSATRAAGGDEEPASAECLTEWSYVGAHVSAVGESVYSLLGGDRAGPKSGTSMSAPQVAGLAAYLFGVRPELTAPEVRDIIVSTARPVAAADRDGCSDYETPAPAIDAYAALLSLDETSDTASVREALLDVDGGGVSATDLDELLTMIEEADGALDYGRADLNGDGYTGGNEETAFDLNHNGATDDIVTAVIQGASREIDEATTTDLDILCYLAFSASLGLPGEGVAPLEDACGGGVDSVGAQFPRQIQVGIGATLIVTVRNDGQPLPGASVDVTATGATSGGDSAQTDVNGEAGLHFLPDPDAEEVVLQITATADGETIGEDSISSTVVPANLQVVERDLRTIARLNLDGTYDDESRNQDPVLEDDEQTVTLEETDSGGGTTESGSATGTARVAHTFDDTTGNVATIDAVCDTDSTASHTGSGGVAEAFGTASYSVTFEVTQPFELNYDFSAEAGTAGCESYFRVFARDNGTMAPTDILSERHPGDVGPQRFMGTTMLVPGNTYTVGVGLASNSAASETINEPGGPCHAEAAFSFSITE